MLTRVGLGRKIGVLSKLGGEIAEVTRLCLALNIWLVSKQRMREATATVLVDICAESGNMETEKDKHFVLCMRDLNGAVAFAAVNCTPAFGLTTCRK